MSSQKKVAIVGAGPAGLAAAKELLVEGHSVTCFERSSTIGGIFRSNRDNDEPGVWANCHLTSSILVTSFSDFFPNWESDRPFEHRHWSSQEYVEYLEQYSVHFGVLPRIRFGTTVTRIKRTEPSWRVTTLDSSGKIRREQFDAVAICSGIHRVAHIPVIEGMHQFAGQIVHSSNYRTSSQVEGHNVLVVGAGESGSEIAAELAKAGKHVFMTMRRGVFVIPRYLNGYPNDYTGTRLLYSLPDFVSRRTDEKAKRIKRQLKYALLPLYVARQGFVLVEDAIRRHRRKRKGLSRRFEKLNSFVPRANREAHRRASELRHSCIEQLVHELRAHALGNQFETFATKSEAFLHAVIDGTCDLRPSISFLSRDGVTFEDGSQQSIDSIVFCTGYKPASVPFLSTPVNLRMLYKHCFDPVLGDSLAFIGFVRPPLGSIPPMAEMQSRWFAQLVSGKCTLPTRAQMHATVARDLRQRETYYKTVYERLPHMVDYATYMDDIAEKIGCKPHIRDFTYKPTLLRKLFTGALCAAQYRLSGPHARPDVARKIILHSYAHAPVVRFFDVALAEFAKVVGMRQLGPQLSLFDRFHHRSLEE